jgi:uncharacterized membrane protein YgcG
MRIQQVFGIVGIAVALASPALARESILDFDSQIVVGTNSTLFVTETIRVAAQGAKINHGIYRDFPQLYRGAYGLRMRTGFKVTEVRRNGNRESYHTVNRENGVRIYIGDKNARLKSGTYTYTITYETDRQLGFFHNFDELYWNVTGNGWEFPIEHASATVHLPGNAAPVASESTGAVPGGMKAYTGRAGQRGTRYVANIVDGNAHFETTKPMLPGEGLTIVVQWAKGVVVEPTAQVSRSMMMADNRGVLLGLVGLLVVLIYYAVAWAAVGKDPKRGTIIPLYAPPDGFSPAAVRFVEHMAFDDRAFAAAIMNLAVKGAVAIREDAKNCYSLIRQSGTNANLLPEERTLLQDLLGYSHTLTIASGSRSTIKAAQKNLKQWLSRSFEKVYFVRNLRYWLVGLICSAVPLGYSLVDSNEASGAIFLLVWLTFWSAGLIFMFSQIATLWRKAWWKAIPLMLFATPFVIAECFALGLLVREASYWVAGVFAAGIVINALFYHLLKAPTMRGRKLLDQIDGLKLYLSVAEKDRLNAENPPKRTPQIFEMFLPYALALGVEQKWSEQFSDVLSDAEQTRNGYSPGWYVGSGGFTTGVSNSLCSSFSGAIASASGSSGGSGGGGGSSGGGGGGGGGGGW